MMPVPSLAGMRTFRFDVKHLIAVCSLLAVNAVFAADTPALSMAEIAPGVYVHSGAQEESSPQNLGDIANIGFIVGSRCVAVIDTGGSIVVGRRLRQAIKNTTRVPVCYVINTHVHPDHIFGNAAFKPDSPTFVGHEKLPQAMAARESNYLNALKRDVGTMTAGTEIILPTLTVKDVLDLDLGGRTLKLKSWRTSHTDNDLTVFDDETQTLWLADLLFLGHLPAVDGSLKGWLETLKELRQMQPRHVVPGHGTVDAAWPQALQPESDYLNLLLLEVREAIKQRRTLQQAVDTVGLSARGQWLLFDAFHRRNVTAAYAELEWED
ncbi:MAG TPA: quinoprotein relay system zinc metallohydrolase 2 [Burkholderiales bacterium]|nr:quinoprotein relay system zinc metallohydrolase 2 [Burkholderiales bacterium]